MKALQVLSDCAIKSHPVVLSLVLESLVQLEEWATFPQLFCNLQLYLWNYDLYYMQKRTGHTLL